MYGKYQCFSKLYYTTDFDMKRLEEDEMFLDFLQDDNREQRRYNLLRQERRNISLRSRGDNHYRKVHCVLIKARKGWR